MPDFGVDNDIERVTVSKFTGKMSAIKDVLRKVGRSDLTRLTELAKLNIAPVIKPGFMTSFAGSTPPDGWLKCDGRAVSRTTYSALFAEIGTKWGVGDSSTTFNLPDRTGAAAVGSGGTKVNGPEPTSGSSIADDATQLNISQMPEHDHDAGDYRTDFDDGHAHSYSRGVPGGNSHYYGSDGPGNTGSQGPHDHPLTGDTANAGGTDKFNVRQPSAHMMVIIKY